MSNRNLSRREFMKKAGALVLGILAWRWFKGPGEETAQGRQPLAESRGTREAKFYKSGDTLAG